MPYNFKFAVIYLIVLLTVIACQSQQPANNVPLMPLQENSTCTNLPCWDGITPGLTTYLDAQALLAARYGHENVVVERYSTNWEADTSGRFLGGSISSDQNGLVDYITIRFAEGQLSVADLIETIGEPSRVFAARAVSSEALCAGSLIIYPNIGIIAWLYPENSSVGVTPTQSVSSLELLTLEMAANWSITDHFILDWQGYDDYCHLASLTPPPSWMRP